MTVDTASFPKQFKLVPPEGGWGYVVAAAVSLTFIVTVAPLAVFGIVYGKFLAELGDETGATTLANGVFNTVLCFAGLPANHMLQKYSYRLVGLIGSVMFFIGAIGNIFIANLWQLMFSFGLFQGIGFGFMMPAVFTAFNSYFEKRQNVVMGICQAIIVAATITGPPLTKRWMEDYGFRGTLAIFAAFSLNGVVAMLVLQPIEWHLKKEELSARVEENGEEQPIEEDALMEQKMHSDFSDILQTKTVSVTSLNGYSCSIQNINRYSQTDKTLSLWGTISKSLDLELFQDPTYVNIAFGLSLGMTSDLAFLSIFPLLLVSNGFDQNQITTVLMVYFVADLISRISLSIVSALTKVWNRYVFLAGVCLSAIFRIAFTMNASYFWILSTSAILGFLRCFIQTPLPLVVAEQYGPRFPTAFSLYMVVSGVVALAVGLLSGAVKNLTDSNLMVVHLLTILYLLCAIPWTLELIYVKMMRKKV